MTIALESEIVMTAYDGKTRTCTYTIQRDGKRWTVKVPLAHLEAHKGHKPKRRHHVAKLLQGAMQGQHDQPAGIYTDPCRPQTAQDFANLKAGAWYLNPADDGLYQKP
jgi:hypothetical protein